MYRMKKKYRKISAYIDGELNEQQAEMVRNWLATDKKCLAWYNRMVSLDDRLLAARTSITGPYAHTRIKQAIASGRKNGKLAGYFNMVWLKKVWFSVPVLAGLVIGLFMGVQVYHSINSPVRQQIENPAVQYFGQDVLPVLPENSFSSNYNQLTQ